MFIFKSDNSLCKFRDENGKQLFKWLKSYKSIIKKKKSNTKLPKL